MRQHSESPQVSIIIPVFNKLAFTRKCLQAIELHTPHDLIEIIIVDNASTDGTRGWLSNYQSPFPLKVLSNSENQGFSKANNQGARTAKGQYLLLLNNDTEVQPGWLPALMAVFTEHENVGAVGAKLLYPDGTIQHAGVITIQDDMHHHPILPCHVDYRRPDGPDYRALQKFPAVTGACMMIPRDLYKRLGGLDESYWNGYEDIDLCFKILEAGFSICCEQRSVVIHHESQSGPQRWVGRKDNQIRLDRKWGGLITCQFLMTQADGYVLNDGVTIVIITHNSDEHIGPCLQNLNKTLRRHDEVVLVDNGSTDRTMRIIGDHIAGKSQFKLISHPINQEFAAAANQGARAGKNPYIVFLSPDIIVGSEWLEHLVFHLQAHKAAAAGPLSNCEAGLQKADLPNREDLENHCELSTLSQRLWHTNQRKSIPAKALAGFCLMVKRKLFNLIGGLDENLFMGHAHLDLSWRLREAGYHLVVAKDTIVLHQGQSDGASETKPQKDRLVQESTDYLFYKMVSHYGLGKVPTAQKLWGMDGFRPECDFGGDQLLTSVIILTFNQLDYTRQCIQSVLTHTRAPFELIIIDNGSTDGTIDYMSSLERSRTACIRIKLIANPENLGFAKGCNQGLTEARGQYLLLLNNDVVVTPGWLSRLLIVMNNRPRAGLVGPVTNYVSGPQLVKAPDYNLISLHGLDRFAQTHAGRYTGQTEAAGRIVGFCMLIRRSVIEKIGGLDWRYGLGNFEDDDFCLRARLAGYQAVIAKDCYVHHFGGRTFFGNKIDYNQRMEQNWRLFKKKWNIRSDTPLGSKYFVSFPTEGFDAVKHFVPLQIEPIETISIAKTQNLHKISDKDREDSNAQPLSSRGTKRQYGVENSIGGISMTILDQVYAFVQNKLSGSNKDAAIWILERIVAEDPSHAETLHALGLLFYEQGRLENAQTHLQQAEQLAPDNPVFVKDLGDFYQVSQNDARQALSMYAKLIQLQPNNQEALLTTGHLNLSQRQFDQARICYQRILEHDPGNIEVRDYLEKLAALTDSENKDPSTVNSPWEIQDKLVDDKHEGDLFELDQISTLDQKLALAHNDHGVQAYTQGDKEAALDHYKKAVSLQPDNPVFLKNLADFFWFELSDARAAMEKYVQVLQLYPSDVETQLACGQICMALGKNDDARDFFNNVLQIEPWSDNAQQLLNQLDGMENFNNTPADHTVLYQQAKSKSAEGDLEGAISDLNRLVTQFPDDATAYNDLGALNFEIGNKEEALAYYEKAVQLAPDIDTFQKNLADFYLMEQERTEDAMKLYVNVLEKNPQDVECLLAIGLVCNSMDKIEDARGFFQQVLDIEPWNHTALQAVEQLDNQENESFQSSVGGYSSMGRQKAIG